MYDALSPRALFFLQSPALIPEVPAIAGVSLWYWIGIGLLIWFALSALFGLLVWPWLARKLFGDREDTTEEEATWLREWAKKKWFRDNQKKNKRDRKN